MRWKDKTQVVYWIFCVLSIPLRFYQARIQAGLYCLYFHYLQRFGIPFAATSSIQTRAVLGLTLASPLPLPYFRINSTIFWQHVLCIPSRIWSFWTRIIISMLIWRLVGSYSLLDSLSPTLTNAVWVLRWIFLLRLFLAPILGWSLICILWALYVILELKLLAFISGPFQSRGSVRGDAKVNTNTAGV